MKTLQSSDPASLLSDLNKEIRGGLSVIEIGFYWRWIIWRWVRVFFAKVELRHQQNDAIRLTFGPVSERPIPKDLEG